VAHQTQDDGFREIQLNGKQLVFLFMAATVVSVAIFLCGVLVGRGAPHGLPFDASAASAVAETTPQQPTVPPAPPPAGSDPTVAAPPPAAADDLSYFNRLDKPNAPVEHLKAASEKSPAGSKTAPAPSAAPPAQKATPSAAAAPGPPAAPAADASSEPAGQGFAVQIAALNVRSEAEAIAKRLTSKGYAAYVLSPPVGTPTVYRVRIGKFNTRREAESMATKLQKEEQFKPWVTR
jgi:cell division septation protein DedD